MNTTSCCNVTCIILPIAPGYIFHSYALGPKLTSLEMHTKLYIREHSLWRNQPLCHNAPNVNGAPPLEDIAAGLWDVLQALILWTQGGSKLIQLCCKCLVELMGLHIWDCIRATMLTSCHLSIAMHICTSCTLRSPLLIWRNYCIFTLCRINQYLFLILCFSVAPPDLWINFVFLIECLWAFGLATRLNGLPMVEL